MKKLKLVSMILLAVMLLSMLPIGILPTSAAKVEADKDWYTRETTDETPTVLEINNAAELLAFAEQLNSGNIADGTDAEAERIAGTKDFAGYVGNIFYNMTIKLNADIVLNEGWDAMAVDPFAATRQVPETVWPVESERYFAGTFDGQGHVISGLYQSYLGKYVGLFGNVKGGTTATVKNLVILNSYVQGSAEGIGSIFGVVNLRPRCLDPNKTTDWYDANRDTRGTIENVYVVSKLVSTGTGRTHSGTGGFAGGNFSDLYITDCAWGGEAIGGVRGVGGAIGQVRSYEHVGSYAATKADLDKLVETPEFSQYKGTNYADKAMSDGTYNYFPDEEDSHSVLKNVYLSGNLVGYNGVEYPTSPQSFVGGVLGYANNAGDRIMLTNVISNSTFDTRVYDAEGNKTLQTVTATDGAVKEGQYLWYTGYVYGGNWGSKNHAEDNPFSAWKYQEWYINNLTYVKNGSLIDNAQAVGKFVGDTMFYFATNLLTDDFYRTDLGYNKTFDASPVIEKDFDEDGTAELFSALRYDLYTKTAIDKKTQVTSIPFIGLDGNLVMNYDGTDTVKRAFTTEAASKEYINGYLFDKTCAINLSDVENATEWDALLASKNYAGWRVVNGMPLPATLATTVEALEAADIQGSTPVADTNWYVNQGGDEATTYEIYNADDLLAFQTEIANGNTFAGKTVVFMKSFALNADMAAEELYSIVDLADKNFAGTIDGRNNTISGLYLDAAAGNVAVFGNVAADTSATVKNLKIENSVIKSTGTVGALFGAVAGELNVSNVWLDVTVNGATAAGAVAGTAATATIKDVIVDGAVSVSAGNAGAVIGDATTATFENVLTTADVTATGATAGSFAGNAGTVTVKNVLTTSKVAGATAGTVFGSVATATATNVLVLDAGNVGKAAGSGSVDAAAISAVTAADLLGKAGEALVAAKGMSDAWMAVGNNPLPKTVYENFYKGLVGYSVSVGQKLSVNIYVKLSGASSFEGSFKLGTAKEKKVYSEQQANGLHKFTFENLAPEYMGDTLVFNAQGYTYETTVKDYLVALLAVDQNLASAMLRWGEAAQNYADYKTDKLVTAGVEGMSAKQDTISSVTNNATYSGTESAEYKVIGTSLYVEDGILKVNVKVRFQDISERQCVTAITGDRAEVNLNYSQVDIVEDENRTYTVVYSNLDIASMNDDVKIVLKDKPNGTELSQTMTTDLSGMMADFMNSDADDLDKALVAAMHEVGAAIAAAN